MRDFEPLTQEIAKKLCDVFQNSTLFNIFFTSDEETKKLLKPEMIKILRKEVKYKLVQVENITTLVLVFPRRINKKFHVLSYSSIVHSKDKPDKNIGLKIILSRIKESNDLLNAIVFLFDKKKFSIKLNFEIRYIQQKFRFPARR